LKTIDWTKLYEKYKGRWVALSEDNETVVGSGPTAKEALDQTHRNGFTDAAIALTHSGDSPGCGNMQYCAMVGGWGPWHNKSVWS
jgi:hypothetical protein